MRYTASGLPPSFITAVRSGFDAFVHLQRHRFASYVELPDGQPREMKALWGEQTSAAATPETLCQWSDLFFLRLKAVSDEVPFDLTVGVVWELVSIVLGVLEGCGDDGLVVNGLYVDWYRSRFVHPEGVEQILNELSSSTPGKEGVLMEIVGPCMVAMQRCFLAGLFPISAQLLSTFMEYLRTFSLDIFSAEEESALADVIHLLLHPPASGVVHAAWADTANRLLVDCKRILGNANRKGGVAMQVAQQLKSLCLDLLLMVSGDAALVLHMCCLLNLDVVDYVAAVCVVCGPPMTLQQMHHLFRTAWDSWEGTVKGPWYVAVVEQLLGCRCVADVVGVMQFVRDAVRRNEHIQSVPATGRLKGQDGDSNFVSSPVSSIASLGEDVGDGSEDVSGVYGEDVSITDSGDDHLLGDAVELPMGGKSLRGFSLLFMAAHVADICAPPMGAPVDQISVTFTRNELIRDYVELFRWHPLLWRTAATYTVYSPFMNPAELYRTVIGQTSNAVRDRYTSLSLQTFIQTSWEDNSPFQVALRRLLHDKYPASATVSRWISAVDFYRHKAVDVLNRKLIREKMTCGDTASAVWLALESQQSKSVQVHFEEILRTPNALLSDEVQRVGQALSSSFISVDASQNLRMLNVLCACAALFEYRKACASAQRGGGSSASLPVGVVQHLLRAADRVLQCAASVRMHPEVILSVLDRAASIAINLPRSLRPRTLLPRLSSALELMFAAHSGNLASYNVKAAPIREKLMRLL